MKKAIKVSFLLYALPLAGLILLFLFFNMTNPVDAGPLGIFTVFTLLYIFWLGVFFICLQVGIVLFNKLFRRKLVSNTRKLYYVASVVAFLPVLLLGIQSVGQLELRDIVLVVLFVGLIIFYIIKRT